MTALYVLDSRLLDRVGVFRRRQLLADLQALDAGLRARGGRLMVRTGAPEVLVPQVARSIGSSRVYWNADVTPFAGRRDRAVADALEVAPSTPFGHLVLPPGSVITRQGRVSQKFSSFHRAWSATRWEEWPLPGEAAVTDLVGDRLPDLDGDPPRPAGEVGAGHMLRSFLGGMADDYRDGRNDLGGPAGSGLSAALRFGTISPRRLVHEVGNATPGRSDFVRQLAWRDWFAHLLAEDPSLVARNLRPEYDEIIWNVDPEGLRAWEQGQTGYPLVDAGMRELVATGSMPNRVRMVAASFLVKDLLVDWRLGERYFRHWLTDGDVSQNVGNWQWVAGTGPDAAPFFRVFNPVLQSRTHDPHGVYIRRWVPELAHLDDASLHAPWEVGPLELAAGGVTLGDNYPWPVVDHGEARIRALAAYRVARGSWAEPKSGMIGPEYGKARAFRKDG